MLVARKNEHASFPTLHGHQAEFAAYQDQIAVLTSERDTLSRELKRSTRMANSNAFLLNSVELQAQHLLSEHDALIVEHQQEKARSQHRSGNLRPNRGGPPRQLLEQRTSKSSSSLNAYRSAQNHGDHLDEMLMLFKEMRSRPTWIETLNRDFAEQRTTLQKVHIQLDLANNAQAIMKRKLQKIEIASQQAQENVESPHSTPPKAQGSIFRSIGKRLSRNGPRQVLHQGSPLVTQEIVKNEKAQPPIAATGTSSSPPTSAHKHASRMLSCLPENPPVAKPTPRDLPNDTLGVSTASIFSDGGVDLLLEPSEDVIGEGNGLATLYSMLSVVRMYAPSPIRGPPEIQPRRRNVDPFKTIHPDDIAKTDGVAVGQT
ncbi:hypothetical protein EV702DRAFT_1147958, partial [Suillus placidus]